MKVRYFFDYSMLRGLIKEKIGTEMKLAEKIGISKTSVSNKLNNQSPFNPTEILEIKKVLDIPDEDISKYFFTQNIRKTEKEDKNL